MNFPGDYVLIRIGDVQCSKSTLLYAQNRTPRDRVLTQDFASRSLHVLWQHDQCMLYQSFTCVHHGGPPTDERGLSLEYPFLSTPYSSSMSSTRELSNLEPIYSSPLYKIHQAILTLNSTLWSEAKYFLMIPWKHEFKMLIFSSLFFSFLPKTAACYSRTHPKWQFFLKAQIKIIYT